MFDKFYGPLAAEKIFVSGQINDISNYFYYPDSNEEYGGPVHQKPNGSYMEGSVHTEEPHEEVRLVMEENYKIQKFSMKLEYEDVGPFVGSSPIENTVQTQTGVPDGPPTPDQGYS